MLSKILRGAILATFAVGATVVHADPFSGSANGYLSYQGQPAGAKTATITTPASALSPVSAGLMSGYFDNNGVDPKNETENFFYFFCIDLYDRATPSFTNYQRMTGLGSYAGEANQLQNLFDKYVTTGSTLTPGVGAVTTTNNAALQLAIWNIIYDTDSTIGSAAGSPGFKAATLDTVVNNLANTMLADSTSLAAPGNQWNYTFYRFNSTCTGSGCPSQDYLAFVRSTPSGDTPLPLPGTLALLGIGLAGLGLARRKS